jgi:ParB family transcriptional regulator, chromosome partitioning protein
MNAQPSIIQVPLSQLRLSAKNSRKKRPQESVERMAASLKAHNQLQNLVVSRSDIDDFYEVDAGGTRLAAFQLRQQRGEISADHLVDCKIVSSEDALEASTAENTLRDAMHPADQFDAFKGMVEAKNSIPDIAAHFGVSELVVKQRLKLANVAPKLVQVYRDGGMDIGQLQALALTDDKKLQEKVWFGAKNEWNRQARDIRHAITTSEIRGDSTIARFVGIDVYEAAGGPVRRDLFSTRGEVFLGDKALLDKLALDKLEAIAHAERAAGWSWVETHLGLDYDKLAAFPHFGVGPKRQKPTAEDKERIAAIETRLEEITKLVDEDDEIETLDADAREALEDEANDLNTEKHALAEGREVWPAEVMAKAGVVVCIGYSGLQIERGRLQPGQKATAAGTVTGTAKGDKKDPPKKAALSQDMVHRLELHRAAAIREHVANDPATALQLLLAHLLVKLLTDSYAESLFDIDPKNVHKRTKGDIDSKFADVGKSPARKALDDRLAAWKKEGLPGKASEIYAWLGTITEAKRLQLLALATALTLNTNGGPRGNALAEQFGVDMTKWWTATPDTYIGVVPKALLAEAVGEVAGKAEGEAVLLLKKDGAMAEAAKKLAGTGWLPKPLRGACYKIGKPATAKATAPAPAVAKKPLTAAKKVAKKAVQKPAKKAAKAAPKKGAK